ncbi:MAG: hypothetical protein M3R13_06365 [Armatimonadota bacterium]|nr:hypothetical protein [Armatimonadota bacterium]
MPKQEEPVQPREAKHGEKMIEVRIRFFTNDIAPEKGHVLPKQAWDNGMIMMDSNEAHGIKPGEPEPFNSILDLQNVIIKVLKDHKIQLRAGGKTKKLLNG